LDHSAAPTVQFPDQQTVVEHGRINELRTQNSSSIWLHSLEKRRDRPSSTFKVQILVEIVNGLSKIHPTSVRSKAEDQFLQYWITKGKDEVYKVLTSESGSSTLLIGVLELILLSDIYNLTYFSFVLLARSIFFSLVH
jgi:hypothetical protein